MATKLSDAGINIISFYIMKMEMDAADVALTTDNPEKSSEQYEEVNQLLQMTNR